MNIVLNLNCSTFYSPPSPSPKPLDADVVIHFNKGGMLHLLSSISPNRFVMLDKVKAELSIHKNSAKQIELFLQFTKILGTFIKLK